MVIKILFIVFKVIINASIDLNKSISSPNVKVCSRNSHFKESIKQEEEYDKLVGNIKTKDKRHDLYVRFLREKGNKKNNSYNHLSIYDYKHKNPNKNKINESSNKRNADIKKYEINYEKNKESFVKEETKLKHNVIKFF